MERRTEVEDKKNGRKRECKNEDMQMSWVRGGVPVNEIKKGMVCSDPHRVFVLFLFG